MGLFDIFKKNNNIINENGLNKIYFNGGKSKKLEMEYYLRNNKKDGKIILYYETGTVEVKGSYKNDKRDGEFISYYKSGNVKK